jgi:hypothetical protein
MHAPSYPMTGSDRPPPQSHDSPGVVMDNLQVISNDMAGRLNEFENAARDRARLGRQWEKRLAIHMLKAQGSNSDMRKANALVAATEQDDLHERLTEAEATFEALRIVMKVLADRSMIGMAVLRAQGRG